MKTILFILFTFCVLFIQAQTWVQKASLPPSQVGYYASSFSIGGKIYAGGGYWAGSARNTFFEYNPATDTWASKANMPNSLFAAAFFTINGKGYIVAGQDQTTNASTVYMYDPTTNSWTQKSNFPGGARYNTIGFSLNGKGYVFGGFVGGATVLNDMWEYDPTNDSWTQKANAPGPGRDGPVAQIISNQAYIGMGCDVSGIPGYTDFYRFDPVANIYTQVASIPMRRAACAHFEIGGMGYFGLGEVDSGSTTTVEDDFYKYDPVADSWVQINNFGGAMRGWVFSEVAGGKPYVGGGSYIQNNIFYNDLWTWDSCHATVSLGNDTSLCSGSILTLRDTASGATFLWSTGATTSSINVTSTGQYWLQVNQGLCVGRDTINVSFSNPPSAFSLGSDTTYCGNFTRLLSTGNANTHWNTGAVASSISVTSPGLYWADITNLCGDVRDSIELTQKQVPNVQLGTDTALCSGSVLSLSDTASAATFLWSTSATTSSINVTSTGQYWLQVNQGLCVGRDTINVSFSNHPAAFSLGSDTTYCGNFTRLLSTGNANTHWNTGAVASSISVTSPGLYWADITNLCGDVRDSIELTQKQVPNVQLGTDTELCSGSVLSLSDTASAATFLWSTSATTSSINVTSTGQYWLDVTQGVCVGRDTINVSFADTLSAITLAGDTLICEDSAIVLNAYEPSAKYRWSTGDSVASILVSQTGTYVVTVSNECGSISASKSIVTHQCACKIAIPTAFSPNNDGKNDRFGILTQCPISNFKIEIYNRWGQLIYVGSNAADKWDGTYRSQSQPTGVYVWYIQYTDPYAGISRRESGNVTLLR